MVGWGPLKDLVKPLINMGWESKKMILFPHLFPRIYFDTPYFGAIVAHDFRILVYPAYGWFN